MTGRAILRQADGTETDITEGVQTLYDFVISSMDWGSGFFTAEDARPVALLARACGFERCEEAERYLREQEQSDQQEEFLRNRQKAGQHPEYDVPHEHVYSTHGKCMWPGCAAKETMP